MKRLFRRKKKSASEAGSIGSGLSGSAYNISPKKDLGKLHRAAFEGDLTKLKGLLKRTDVNQLDKENRTPLHLACANGKYDAVSMLCDHPHVNLDLCDNERKSALMKCVQCEHQTCLKTLLDKGADVTLGDENGSTALHIAASIPNSDICYLLSDYKANPIARNKDGATALHIASSLGSDEIVKLLLGLGVDINDMDDSSKTPLMHAAHKGQLTTVKLLLSKNANSALRDTNGWTADDYASMDGFHPISHIITEHNARRGGALPTFGHSTALRTPQTSPQRLGPQTNVGFGGPAMDSRDSDSDDSLSAEKAGERKDSWGSTSSEQEPKYATVQKKADRAKPRINVTQALNWKKNNPHAASPVAAESMPQSPSKATTSLFFTASAREQLKKQEEEEDKSDGDFEEQEPKNRYESKSARGEPVSPKKPPLPMPRASPQVGRAVEDDDSSWDSTDEGSVPEPQPITDISRRQPHAESGQTAKKTSVVNEQKQTVEESDSWDDSFSEREAPVKTQQNGFNYLKKSSELKFDDETDSEANAVKPSSSPESKPNLVVRDGGDAGSDGSSSWNSDKIVKGAQARPAKVSSPLAVKRLQYPGSPGQSTAHVRERDQSKGLGIAYGARLSGGDVSTESEMESESSWEQENRAKRSRLFNGKIDREKEQLSDEEYRKVEGDTMGEREEGRKRLEENSKREEVKKRRLEAGLLEEEKRRRVEKKKEREEEERLEREKRKREEEDKKKRDLEQLEKMNRMNQELERENAELKRKAQEEERRKEEQDGKAKLDSAKAAVMNESLRAALERAADVTSESGDSDVEQRGQKGSRMDAIEADSCANRTTPPVFGSKTQHKGLAVHDAAEIGRGKHVVDLDTLTEETDEDLSLQSDQQSIGRSHTTSPLLDSLKLVEEKQGLSLRLAKEKDAFVVAQGQLETVRRENEQLKTKERSLVERRKEWELEKVGMTAENRKAGFEVKNLEENLVTVNLKLSKQEERSRRLEEQLLAEREERRHQEVLVGDFRIELKNSNAARKRFELECAELRKKVATEDQSKILAKSINEGEYRPRETSQHETAKDGRVESLERVVNEKNQELIKVKAERDRYEDASSRYKSELAKLRSKDADHHGNLVQLNQDLNERLDEKEVELRESEEALQLTALQTVQFKQAYENLTRQLENEKRGKEFVVRDLEVLSAQQLQWKSQVEDSRSSLLREQERSRRLEDAQERIKEKEEGLQEKLLSAETKVNRLENELRMVQHSSSQRVEQMTTREIEYEKSRDASKENEKVMSKLRREMAEQSVKIEALKIELRQREDKCLEMRREKEDLRSRNSVAVDIQQENFTAKIAALQKEHENERVAFETRNVQLAQQIEHWKSESGRFEREKAQKEEDLARAQHDRIEAHKQLGYADAFSKSASEEQKHLLEENTRVNEDNIRLQSRVSLLEQKLEEKLSTVADLQREVDGFHQSSANANRTIDSLSGNQRLAESGRAKLEQQLKEAELENIRLSSELESAKSWKTRLQESREEDAHRKATLEERISKLECDKVIAEEKLTKEVENGRALRTEVITQKGVLEAERKSLSDLETELSKAAEELEEERMRAEAMRSRLDRTLEEKKLLKTKYERLKRESTEAVRATEAYRSASGGWGTSGTESGSDIQTSVARERHGEEVARRDATVAKLRDQVAHLTRQLKEKKRLRFPEETNRNVTSSHEIERLQRDNTALRSELGQLQARVSDNYVDRTLLEAARQDERSKAQAALAPTLDQVNSFLKSQQAAQEFRDQLMLQREESAAVQSAMRIASLEEEVRNLRRRREDRPYAATQRHGAELSQLYQDARKKNEILEQQLARANVKVEEYKGNWAKERVKFQTFFSGSLGGGRPPAAGDILDLPRTNDFATYSNRKLGGPSLPLDGAWSSTPKRELLETPLLSQFRDKLDASIAHHLGGTRVDHLSRSAHNGYTSPASRVGSPRSPGLSPQPRDNATSSPGLKRTQNEYMSFLRT